MKNNYEEFIDYSDVRELTIKEKIKDVFTNPVELFKSLKFHPNLKLSISIIVLLSFLASFIDISSPEFINNTIESAKESGQEVPSGSQLEIYKYMAIFFTTIIPLVIISFKAFMITGLSVLVGGDGDTREGLLVTTYSYIPVAIATLISKIIVRFTSLDFFDFNLAMLLPDSLQGTVFFGLALSLDIFIIWYLVLSFIGTRYIFEISYKRAITPVLIPWIIWIVLYAGLTVVLSGGINLF